ncbi:unnamed protein product, partial [Meganyctiphanes norvegica]
QFILIPHRHNYITTYIMRAGFIFVCFVLGVIRQGDTAPNNKAAVSVPGTRNLDRSGHGTPKCGQKFDPHGSQIYNVNEYGVLGCGGDDTSRPCCSQWGFCGSGPEYCTCSRSGSCERYEIPRIPTPTPIIQYAAAATSGDALNKYGHAYNYNTGRTVRTFYQPSASRPNYSGYNQQIAHWLNYSG